jgi:RNA-directed DNA polymerase
VDELLKKGLVHVVDVDIKGYFDSIPHDRLMGLVQERIADGRVLELLESFLQQGIMSEAGAIEKEHNEEGTPQGGVISPLLANIYLNPLDQLMSAAGHQMVRYADDMVILCPSEEAAKGVLQTLRKWTAQAGLILHPEKTRLVDMGQPGASFEFLGYNFWRSRTRWKILRFIRKKSVKKIQESLKPLTRRSSGESLRAIAEALKERLRGVYEYFKHAEASALGELDGWVRGRLRSLMRRRRGLRGRGRGRDHHRWSNHYFTSIGLFSLEEARRLEPKSLRIAGTC